MCAAYSLISLLMSSHVSCTEDFRGCLHPVLGKGVQKGEPLLLPKRKLLSDRGLQAPGPGPLALWGRASGMTARALLCACRNITEMMTTVSLQIVGIIEPIIQHADWFFPGGTWGVQWGRGGQGRAGCRCEF